MANFRIWTRNGMVPSIDGQWIARSEYEDLSRQLSYSSDAMSLGLERESNLSRQLAELQCAFDRRGDALVERQDHAIKTERELARVNSLLVSERAAMDVTQRQTAERAAEVARMRSALEDACDQILDSYRTWVADDTTAHPRPGQIPRYDTALAALATEREG